MFNDELALQPEKRDPDTDYEGIGEPLPEGDISLVTFISGDLVKRYTGVLVEGWEHAKFGRGRRLYQLEFKPHEREALRRLYNRAYGWVLRTGHPKRVRMSVNTYRLLVRAAEFFAQI